MVTGVTDVITATMGSIVERRLGGEGIEWPRVIIGGTVDAIRRIAGSTITVNLTGELNGKGVF